MQVLSTRTMVVAPENYPDDRFTEMEVLAINWVRPRPHYSPLNTTRGGCYRTRVCQNEDARTWIKQAAPNMGVGGRTKVVAGDYTDLMRTTRAFLRPPDLLAKRYAKQILKRNEIHNSGNSTGAWRVTEGEGFFNKLYAD